MSAQRLASGTSAPVNGDGSEALLAGTVVFGAGRDAIPSTTGFNVDAPPPTAQSVFPAVNEFSVSDIAAELGRAQSFAGALFLCPQA